MDPIERYEREPAWWNLLWMGIDYTLGVLSLPIWCLKRLFRKDAQ